MVVRGDRNRPALKDSAEVATSRRMSEMGLDFVAIDFETANASRASACAVGLAVVEDGVVTAQDSWRLFVVGRGALAGQWVTPDVRWALRSRIRAW